MLIQSEVEVRAPGGDYRIKIGENLFPLVASETAASAWAQSCAVITDSNVARICAPALMAELEKSGCRAHMFEFPAGESNKTRQTKQNLEDAMQEALFGRDCGVIALGGGVAGDVAGFVAATYCRGVPYVQVPTTLVACVDSAVGGKTGIDTPAGKNLVGAFHQPLAVYADISLLSTLPSREIAMGIAEVIKYGVIKDPALFEFLEKNVNAATAGEPALLRKVVERSCAIKATVVEKDERESGLRKILNFGHTVGHAVEQLSGYAVGHGDAVAIGMVAEAEISRKMGLMPEGDVKRIDKLVRAAGLQSEIPAGMEKSLCAAMKMDKKVRAGKIEMALPLRIGEMFAPEGEWGTVVDESLI